MVTDETRILLINDDNASLIAQGIAQLPLYPDMGLISRFSAEPSIRSPFLGAVSFAFISKTSLDSGIKRAVTLPVNLTGVINVAKSVVVENGPVHETLLNVLSKAANTAVLSFRMEEFPFAGLFTNDAWFLAHARGMQRLLRREQIYSAHDFLVHFQPQSKS